MAALLLFLCASAASPPKPKPHSGASELVNPCLDANATFRSQPWCDSALPIERRVADMISVRFYAQFWRICGLNRTTAGLTQLSKIAASA